MKIGVLGTGMVGQTLASRLAALGHEVMMGSRHKGNEKAAAWAQQAGQKEGSFADAAAFGEVLLLCVKGEHAEEALQQSGSENLQGKVLLDITNALAFGPKGPGLMTKYIDSTSLAEELQKANPGLLLVKTLNTLTAPLMADPAQLAGGDHSVFLSSDHAEAKDTARQLLTQMGWKEANIVDLGGLVSARGAEAYVLFWLMNYQAMKNHMFNVKLVK